MENYTGIIVSGLCSTPHTIKVYIRGNIEASFNINAPKGEDCRKNYDMMMKRLRPLIEKIK